jgi:teichuronic acid biosynthesis glycosyltransferase TuaC
LKVLFVSSGNKGIINPLIKAQIDSLLQIDKQNIDIDTYLIKGQGLAGYLRNINPLRKVVKNGNYNCIHAHYSFSGIVASLGGSKPVITSLMGSDINKNKFYKFVAKIFVRYFWAHTIVKSNDMAIPFPEGKVTVIPNGVDIAKFTLMNREQACKEVGWNRSKTHITFAANPSRPEKNFQLADTAFKFVSKRLDNLELHILENVPHKEIPIFINASDVVVLSSKWEGSPNVIKEAMACNRPIVCTDVGDVSWLFGNEEGHFISSHDVNDFSEKLEECILYSKHESKTNGRNRILELKLDSESVAKRIKAIYEKFSQ